MEVPIRDETIRLGQLLKLAGVADDGAQARPREVAQIDRKRASKGRSVRPHHHGARRRPQP
ncbi:MAG: RNA-binding S4 domain-containing protein [Dermatophilaceae bacterium]